MAVWASGCGRRGLVSLSEFLWGVVKRMKGRGESRRTGSNPRIGAKKTKKELLSVKLRRTV